MHHTLPKPLPLQFVAAVEWRAANDAVNPAEFLATVHGSWNNLADSYNAYGEKFWWAETMTSELQKGIPSLRIFVPGERPRVQLHCELSYQTTSNQFILSGLLRKPELLSSKVETEDNLGKFSRGFPLWNLSPTAIRENYLRMVRLVSPDAWEHIRHDVLPRDRCAATFAQLEPNF